jgi:hypothetical protein
VQAVNPAYGISSLIRVGMRTLPGSEDRERRRVVRVLD